MKIDINKEDREHTTIISWLVGKEFTTGDAEGLSADPRPLEAFRLLLSEVATTGHVVSRKVLISTGVSRASFEALMQRNGFIELPAEATNEEDRIRGHGRTT